MTDVKKRFMNNFYELEANGTYGKTSFKKSASGFRVFAYDNV